MYLNIKNARTIKTKEINECFFSALLLVLMTFATPAAVLGNDTEESNDQVNILEPVMPSLDVINVNRKLDSFFFALSMVFYTDDSRNASINDIVNANNSEFIKAPAQQQTPTFAFTKSIVWAKFTLGNNSEKNMPVLIESRYAQADYVFLYQKSDGEWKETKLGDKIPYDEWQVNYHYPVFSVDVPPGETTYYVRIDSDGSTIFPFFIWDPDSFSSFQEKETLFIGSLFGFLVAMAAYNIFLTISFRSKTFLIYVFNIIFLIAVLASFLGVGMQLLQTDGISWLSNEGLLVMIGLSEICSLLFSMRFLETKEKLPIGHWILLAFTVIMIGLTGFAFVNVNYDFAAKAINGCTAIICLILITTGVIRSIQGYRPAYFYTLAWTLFLVGTIAVVLKIQGKLPVNDITVWGQSVGIALETILLSLALADRVNLKEAEAKEVIEKANEKLELRVEEQTREIKSILKNINQGIFTINEEGLIADDYSNHLEKILGRTDLSGKNPKDILFENSSLTTDQVSSFTSVINSSMGDDEVAWTLNEHLLIKEYELTKEGTISILEIDLDPVFHDDQMTQVLVAIRDVTQLRKLQAESEKAQLEIKFISEIVNITPKKFNSFVVASKSWLVENKKMIESHDELNLEVVKKLFINMHTMKGEARTNQFVEITAAIHNAEQVYSDMQHHTQEWEKEKLLEDLNIIQELLDTYVDVAEKKLGRTVSSNAKSSLTLDQESVQQYTDMVSGIDIDHLKGQDQAIFKRIKSLFVNAFRTPLEDVLADELVAMTQAARELNKKVPIVEFNDPGFNMKPEIHKTLVAVYTHVLGNCVAHGIEDEEERVKAGKESTGKIRFRLEEENESIAIYTEDDGRGLNLPKVREKAVREGLIEDSVNLTDDEIAQFIFESGLTTAEQLSNIAGRGVGMDAIRNFIEDMGGRVEVSLLPHNPTQNGTVPICVPFTLKVTIPKIHCLDEHGNQESTSNNITSEAV